MLFKIWCYRFWWICFFWYYWWFAEHFFFSTNESKKSIISIYTMLASGRLTKYNWKMHNFYFCKREKDLSTAECCISGYLLLLKSPSNLWRQSFLSDIFADLPGVDERHLDLPGQLSLIPALHCKPTRKRDFPALSCTLLFCHVNKTWPWLRSDEKYFLYKGSLHKWGLTLCSKTRED